MRVGFGGREPDGTETGKRQAWRQTVFSAADQSRERAGIRKIVFASVTLMAVLVPDIVDRQNRLRIQRMLYAYAVLIARRKFVVIHGQASNIRGINRPTRCRTGSERYARVIQSDALEADVQTERNVRTGVVHVVALNALVHHAEAAADHRLAAARHVIGKTKTRTKGRPVVVHEPLRNTIFFRNADTIQVQWNTRENGVRARPEARAGWIDGPESRVVRICDHHRRIRCVIE